MAAAVAAFTVLCMYAIAPAVQSRGSVPDRRPGSAHDILVHGPSRVTLSLPELWYRGDTGTVVAQPVDPHSVGLLASVLLIGWVLVAGGVMALVHRRRREVTTLRALGWRRRDVASRLRRELALIALTAWMVATLAAYGLEAASRGHLATAWPLLSLPVAIAMTLVAVWWQVRRATADHVQARAHPGRPVSPLAQPGSGGLRRAVGSLRRSPRGSALRLGVMIVACATFGLELGVRWVSGGVIVGSWLGRAVSWEVDAVGLAAVMVILALATITMACIGWRHAGERSAELRTLRAIGWPAHRVAKLAAGEALLLGLTGGLVASALDVAGILAIVRQPPPGLGLVAVAVIVVCVAMSLATVSLSAALERATRSLA